MHRHLRGEDAAVALRPQTGGGAERVFDGSVVWGRITGSTSIGDNKWSYAWEVVTLNDADAWAAMTTGRGSGTLGLALNSMEAPNSDTGLQGNGIVIEDLCDGTEIAPVATGTVHRMYGQFGSSATPRWVFSSPNGVRMVEA